MSNRKFYQESFSFLETLTSILIKYKKRTTKMVMHTAITTYILSLLRITLFIPAVQYRSMFELIKYR